MNQAMLITAAERLCEAMVEYFGSGEYVRPFRSKDLADCVLQHAAATAASAMAAGILPGAGAAIATTLAAGSIWAMYIRICKIIDVDLGKNKLKTFASAILSNIATDLIGILGLEVALSFIPVAGIITCGVVNFVVVYAAGLVFLKILTNLFSCKRGDIEDLSKEELDMMVKGASMDIKKLKTLFLQ